MVLAAMRPALPAADPPKRREDRQAEEVEEELVVDLDRAEDVGAGGAGAARDQAAEAEEAVDDEGGDHDRDEHQRGDPQGEGGAVVLAVGEDDRDHDQVGEEEGDDPSEADSARPEHGSKRHVADRADEAEDRDDRPDDDVLDRLHERRRVGDEEEVEEIVAEQADEAGEQEAEADLLPEHLPVAAEVAADARPGRAAGEALAPGECPVLIVVAMMVVAGLRLLGVAPRLLLQSRRDEHAQEHRHQADQDDPAEELGEGELPAHQHPEDEAELPDEVGRRELEGEGGDRRGALLEERLGDRDRRIGAGGGGGAEGGRLGDRGETLAGEGALDPRLRHPGLNDCRDREAEHQRPPDLIRHQERHFEPLPDLAQHVAHRPPNLPRAAISSSTFSTRSPSSLSTTQCRVCSSSSPSATLSSAAWTAPIWVSTSMQ